MRCADPSRERQLLSQIFIDLLDAETGQRGYLLTHNPDYLGPYTSAIGRTNADFRNFLRTSPTEPMGIRAIWPVCETWLIRRSPS